MKSIVSQKLTFKLSTMQNSLALAKGWSERQLHYCLRVAEIFPDVKALHTLCAELKWSHIQLPAREALQAKLHQSIALARAKLNIGDAP